MSIPDKRSSPPKVVKLTCLTRRKWDCSIITNVSKTVCDTHSQFQTSKVEGLLINTAPKKILSFINPVLHSYHLANNLVFFLGDPILITKCVCSVKLNQKGVPMQTSRMKLGIICKLAMTTLNAYQEPETQLCTPLYKDLLWPDVNSSRFIIVTQIFELSQICTFLNFGRFVQCFLQRISYGYTAQIPKF